MPTHITIPLHDIGKYHIFKQPLSSSSATTTIIHAAPADAGASVSTTSTTTSSTTTTTASGGGAGGSSSSSTSTSSNKRKKPRTDAWMSTTQKEEERPFLLVPNKVDESSDSSRRTSTGIKNKEEHHPPPPQQEQQDNKFYENNTEARGYNAVAKNSEEAVTTYTNKKKPNNEEDGTTTTTDEQGAPATRTISPVEQDSLPGPSGGEIPPATRIMNHSHTNVESLLHGVLPPDVPVLLVVPDTASRGTNHSSAALSRGGVAPPTISINADTGASTNGGKAQKHQVFLTMQRHVYFVPLPPPPFHHQAPPRSNPPPPPPPPPSPCVATRIQRRGNYYRSIESSQLNLMTHMRRMAIELMGSLPPVAGVTSMASSSCLARPRENGFPESGTVEIPTFLKNIVHDPLLKNHFKQENIQGKEYLSKFASMACRCKLKVRNVGHSRFKGAKCDPVTGRKKQNKFRTKGEEISTRNARRYFVLLKKSFSKSSKGFSLPLETDHWDAILPTIYNAFGPGFHDRESLPEYSKGDEVPLALPTRLNKLPIEFTKVGETLGLKTCACKQKSSKHCN